MGKTRNTKYGFTLIELLITIFLISVGLIGVIVFFNASLQSQFDAKNEVIAAGLAQEGTEIARHIVDSYYLNEKTDWYGDLYEKNGSPKECEGIDRDVLFETGIEKCKKKPKKGYNLMCYDKVKGVYQLANQNKDCDKINTNWTDGGFIRIVKVEINDANEDGLLNLDNGDCLKVTATVGWPVKTGCNRSSADCDSCDRKTTSTDIICKPRQ